MLVLAVALEWLLEVAGQSVVDIPLILEQRLLLHWLPYLYPAPLDAQALKLELVLSPEPVLETQALPPWDPGPPAQLGEGFCGVPGGSLKC